MEKGKHDIGTPINESLEKHYQDEKRRLLTSIETLKTELNEKNVEIEKLKFKIKLKNIEIESLVKAMAGGDLE